MGEMVELKSFKAYLSKPKGQGLFPAVIVIHEWWGLNENIKQITDRFAKEGFIALAVDLFKGKIASSAQEAQKMVDDLDSEEALANLLEASEYLHSTKINPDVGKAGVTGFCMGGKYALLLGSIDPSISAVAPFYGHVPNNLALDESDPPVLGQYGAEDDGIPLSEVEELEKILAEAGVEHELIVYPGVGHAFMNDTNPHFKKDIAEKAWKRVIEFFQKNLL